MKAGNAKNSVASVCVSNYNKLGAVFIFVKEGKIMQEKEKGGFSFINEQIKEKPLNKKRLVKKALFTVALAVIFGAVAALVFSLLQPEFSNWFYPEEKPVVTIPQDDVTETEEPSQGDIQEASEQKDTQETENDGQQGENGAAENNGSQENGEVGNSQQEQTGERKQSRPERMFRTMTCGNLNLLIFRSCRTSYMPLEKKPISLL